MSNRNNYNLYLMGKDELVWMYFDSHTTIKEVFKERMNRARNDYLRSSKTQKFNLKNICVLKIDNADETIIGGTVESVIFNDWHNERYLKQCLMNLQEKYDCGGISEDEWKIIENKFGKYL